MEAGQAKRLLAVESQDPVVRAATQHVIQKLGDLPSIHHTQLLDFDYQGDREFISVVPWRESLINDILKVSRLQTSEYQMYGLEQALAQRSQIKHEAKAPLPNFLLHHYLKQMPPAWINQQMNLHEMDPRCRASSKGQKLSR